MADTFDPRAVYPWIRRRRRRSSPRPACPNGFEFKLWQSMAAGKLGRRGASHRRLRAEDRREEQGPAAGVGQVQQRAAASRLRTASSTRPRRGVGHVVRRAALGPRASRRSGTPTPQGTFEDHPGSGRRFDAKRSKDLGAQALKGLHAEGVWLFLWQLDDRSPSPEKVKGFKMRADGYIWVRDTYVEA